jgi:UDP-glucose 4-epimerase
MTLTIAVTGGNGFIGKTLVKNLIKNDLNVISLQRSKNIPAELIEVRQLNLSSIDSITETLLEGIDILVHMAAIVHNSSAKADSYDKLNFEATKKLFELSVKVSVQKFIFISSVGVYGLNCYKSPIDINFPTNPKSDYAKSKLKSEVNLLSMYQGDIKVSIFRLPLVYGNGSRGNYSFLEKISKTKIPLPFGATNNKRSLVSVEQVTKVLLDAIKNQDLYLGLNLIAEEHPTSTKEIIVKLRNEYGMSPNLFPIPKIFMKLFLTIIGKNKVYEQLYENLVFNSSIDMSKYH